MTEERARSPDGAKRNPGQLDPCAKIPDYATLHPGYETANKKPAVPQDGGLISGAKRL